MPELLLNDLEIQVCTLVFSELSLFSTDTFLGESYLRAQQETPLYLQIAEIVMHFYV